MLSKFDQEKQCPHHPNEDKPFEFKPKNANELLVLLNTESIEHRVKLGFLMDFKQKLLPFPFKMIEESFKGKSVVNLCEFFDFVLNSLCYGSESIKPEILPLFFLLVSFSMQHEETDALASLTKDAWQLVTGTQCDIENKMDELLKDVWKE